MLDMFRIAENEGIRGLLVAFSSFYSGPLLGTS